MVKNWAIAIGINQYDFLQPLRFAQRDAELMQKFLQGEAGFEQIFFFSDNSPDINGKSTQFLSLCGSIIEASKHLILLLNL
jgi:uncharacterized caspase-like protein